MGINYQEFLMYVAENALEKLMYEPIILSHEITVNDSTSYHPAEKKGFWKLKLYYKDEPFIDIYISFVDYNKYSLDFKKLKGVG